MENWWIDGQLPNIRQKELLQEAAHCRLLHYANRKAERSRRMAHQSGEQPQSLFIALRCNLGQRLIDWGTFLKQSRVLSFKRR